MSRFFLTQKLIFNNTMHTSIYTQSTQLKILCDDEKSANRLLLEKKCMTKKVKERLEKG